jgi:hypothetical protein
MTEAYTLIPVEQSAWSRELMQGYWTPAGSASEPGPTSA